MPVARNMKDIQEMYYEAIKKKLPDITTNYCHKWYANHPDLEKILPETKFVQMVNESLEISVSDGTLKTKFGIFQNEEIEEEHLEHMKVLWEDFKTGYCEYLKVEVFKQK